MDCPNPRRSRAVAACLPDEVLVDVFSRLPVKCLHRSKCVCKRWRDIIADPLHRKILAQTLVGFFATIRPEDGALSWHKFVNLLGTSVPSALRMAPPPLLDPSFAFLNELPAGIECSRRKIADSCNGLLLFEYGQLKLPESMGYIVFNPATQQRVVVPGIWTAGAMPCLFTKAYLLFDPSVSSHFRILLFWKKEERLVTVHAYSSETRAWSHSERDWSPEEQRRPQETWRRHYGICSNIFNNRCVFVDGKLYLYHGSKLFELDVEGKTQSIIQVPPRGEGHPFFGQYQGRLYCIIRGVAGLTGCDLSIWVMKDHGTRKNWVLKHTVNYMQLFGTECRHFAAYNVLDIHPDCNTLFILNSDTQKLISYDVDSNRVRDLCTLDHRCVSLIPYVPCFKDLLSN